MTQLEILNKRKEIREQKTEMRNKIHSATPEEMKKIENDLNTIEIEERNLLQEESKLISEGKGNYITIDKLNGSLGSLKGPDNKGIALRSADKFADRVNVKEEDRNLDLGKYVKGIVTGNWTGAEAERRAMLTTATGVLIPEMLSANIIDLARSKSLFTIAGVPVIPMETDNITISKVKTDPIFKFKAEGETALESSMELDSVTLKSKMVYGYAYISLEAIKSSKNLESVILNTFSQAIAQGIDQGMLYGQYNGTTFDTFAPSGIMNDVNVNVVAATVGGGYDSIIKAIGKVKTANGDPTVYGINAQTEELFSLLKDTTNQYIAPPKAVTDLKPIVSNQLKYNVTTGSDGLVFDPNSMIIGIQEGINIKMYDGDTDSIKKGLVCFRIYSMLDCVTLVPKNITKVTGLK